MGQHPIPPNPQTHVSFLLYRDPRYFSGVLSAVISGFITYVYLEPLFVPVGLELAIVALWILSIAAGLVGMSLGVLLPAILPGVCLGVSLSLLVGAFLGMSQVLYFPVAGGALSLLGILLSTRYVLLGIGLCVVLCCCLLNVCYRKEGTASTFYRWQLFWRWVQ